MRSFALTRSKFDQRYISRRSHRNVVSEENRGTVFSVALCLMSDSIHSISTLLRLTNTQTRGFSRNITISVQREIISLSLLDRHSIDTCISLSTAQSPLSLSLSLSFSPLSSAFYNLTRSILPPLVLPSHSLPTATRALSHRPSLPNRLQHAITHASSSHTHAYIHT